ncbi:MAG TPA: divalent-cation tolerance protein CutA [Kofleriaceae bacterium]|nr:divalent-cation tolerance protein CutA [Kofleriaceae bacterium]
MTTTDVLVVLCTFPTGEPAAQAAERLVGERLAACVNLVPGLTSVYRWKGEVTRDEEVLAVIKTTADQFPALKVRLIELHPYECPEVIALEVERGHRPYLDWVRDSTGPE